MFFFFIYQCLDVASAYLLRGKVIQSYAIMLRFHFFTFESPSLKSRVVNFATKASISAPMCSLAFKMGLRYTCMNYDPTLALTECYCCIGKCLNISPKTLLDPAC